MYFAAASEARKGKLSSLISSHVMQTRPNHSCVYARTRLFTAATPSVPVTVHLFKRPVPQMTIDTVKNKLSSHTGSSPLAMVLQLKDDKGNLMATLTDPYKPLGFYSPYDGWVFGGAMLCCRAWSSHTPAFAVPCCAAAHRAAIAQLAYQTAFTRPVGQG